MKTIRVEYNVVPHWQQNIHTLDLGIWSTPQQDTITYYGTTEFTPMYFQKSNFNEEEQKLLDTMLYDKEFDYMDYKFDITLVYPSEETIVLQRCFPINEGEQYYEIAFSNVLEGTKL